jgi:hypothetical protein
MSVHKANLYCTKCFPPLNYLNLLFMHFNILYAMLLYLCNTVTLLLYSSQDIRDENKSICLLLENKIIFQWMMFYHTAERRKSLWRNSSVLLSAILLKLLLLSFVLCDGNIKLDKWTFFYSTNLVYFILLITDHSGLWYCAVKGQMADSCEHNNPPSHSMQIEELLD